MVDYTETAYSAMSTIWTFVQIFIGMGVAVAIIFLIWALTQYKHKFRLRELTGDKTRIIDDRAREVKRKGDPLKWRLFKTRINVPVPPPAAIHLTKKGKFSVEAYRTPEGEVKYIIDKGISAETAATFESVTTQDREFYIDEMREAESYVKKQWTEYVLPIAGVFSVLVVLILLFVFWEDIAQPAIDIQNRAGEINRKQAEIIEDQRQITLILKEIIQERQVVEGVIPNEYNTTN